MDNPFSNHMVLEGSGRFDAALWEKAVQAASEANPGSRLIYKGCSGWARWVDSGLAPPVRYLNDTGWSGRDPQGAGFLCDPLPMKSSHTCEVVLVDGNPLRVVLRTLHATMDGGGTILWARDIFRALRGEPLVGSSSTITDFELLAQTQYPTRWKGKPRRYPAPTGPADGGDKGCVWKRVTLRGKFPKLLPQVAWAVAQETRKLGPAQVCFNVPMDLRRRLPGVLSTANLSRRIELHVPPDATVDMLQQQLLIKLKNPNANLKLLKIFEYVPLGGVAYLFKFLRQRSLRTGVYHSTGSISHFGRLPLAAFQGGGFKAATGFFIPPGTEAKPFFMSLAICGEKMELVTCMPNCLASNGRLDRFVDNVAGALKPCPNTCKSEALARGLIGA